MRSRKGHHLILGLDGDRVTLTTASIKRGQFVIRTNRDVQAASTSDELRKLVVEALSQAKPRPDSVHVIFGGGEATRFSMNLPRLRAAERAIVLGRRSRQEASVPVDAPIEFGSARAGRAGGDFQRYRVAAFPKSALAKVEALRRDPLIHVETLSAWEDAALHALPDDLPEHAVVLDRNRRGVCISYLTGGALTHERQVMFPVSGSDDPGKGVEELRFELARTLDYFAGEGSPPPEGVAFTPGLGFSDDVAQSVTEALPVFKLDLPALPATAHAVALPPLGLLRALSGRGAIPWLDAGRPTRSRGRKVAVSALILATGAAAFGVREAGAYERRSIEEAERLDPLIRALEAEQTDLIATLALKGEATPEQERLKSVLGMRRPASRFLAVALRAVPSGLLLLEVGYDEGERMTVLGEARGLDRLSSVEALVQFRERLAATPFLEDVAVQITYPAEGSQGGPTFGFAVHGRWGRGR